MGAALGDDETREQAKCRRCGCQIEVPGFVVELARKFNRELHRRGEPLITRSELATCDACIPAENAALAKRAASESSYAAGLLRKVRQGVDLPPAQMAYLYDHGFGKALGEALAGRDEG
jgi:hypothetical protein